MSRFSKVTRASLDDEWERAFCQVIREDAPQEAKAPKDWERIHNLMRAGYTPERASKMYCEYVAAQRVINPDKLMWHNGFSREGWYRWHPVVGYLFTGSWADEVPSLV